MRGLNPEAQHEAEEADIGALLRKIESLEAGMKRQLALILQKSLSLGILPKVQSGERRVFHGKKILMNNLALALADCPKIDSVYFPVRIP